MAFNISHIESITDAASKTMLMISITADVSAFMTISDVSEIVGNHIKRKKAPAKKVPVQKK